MEFVRNNRLLQLEAHIQPKPQMDVYSTRLDRTGSLGLGAGWIAVD